MDTATHDSSKWWAPWSGRRRATVAEPDVLVATWKAVWLEGANAAWAPHRPVTNPHAAGMEQAAWDAGWKWASQNPNRRANRAPRFAHPLRRASDSTFTTSLKRAAAVGATGITLYALTKAFSRWRRTDAP